MRLALRLAPVRNWGLQPQASSVLVPPDHWKGSGPHTRHSSEVTASVPARPDSPAKK